MTTIVTGNGGRRYNYPYLFEDMNIESLLLFGYKGLIRGEK